MTSALPPAGPPAIDPLPPAGGPPARPELRRSRSDRVLGGVCGGLADYSGVDALLWRVGFVALTLAGGTGVFVYLLLWLLMPGAPRGGALARAGAPVAAGPRSAVPGLTLAGVLIVVGVLVLLATVADVDLGPRVVLGTALLAVGLGLVAAAFSARRTAKGGLIALGVALSAALVAVTAVPWETIDGEVGDRTWRPATAEGVRPVYSGGIGTLTLDLSAVDVADLDRPVTTRIEAGIGDVLVQVPRSADVEVVLDTGVGNVDVLGEQAADGGFYEGLGAASWTGDGEPEIVLTIDAGFGDVEVDRA